MKDHSGMRETWQTRSGVLRDSMAMMLASYGAARAGTTHAAEPAARFELPRPQLAAPLFAPLSSERSFAAPPLRMEPEAFSPTEFRPRKRALLDVNAGRSENTLADMPRLQDNSFARQIPEFKSQDRLRLLTLWQSSASSLSLQAGKGGAPSLQWSTPWMHRGSGSRGLFDHLLSVSPRGAFGAPRSNSLRPSGASNPSKSLDPGSTAKSQ
jgi:hypothetical protein